MKKVVLFFSAAFLLVALISTSSFIVPPPGPSANGQCALLQPYFNGMVQHFSFHAKMKNGAVTGSWESKSPGQELRTHGKIDCLTILPDGKTAIMSGVITHRTGDGFPGAYQIGSRVWFKVIDNGQGNNSAADQFSDYYSSSAPCTDFNQPMYDIVNGNVQVKP